MSSNEEMVREKYSGGREDGRASRSRSGSLEFYYTERIIRELLPENARILEVGCGTGYYGFLFAGRCASYLGIDLSPENIEILEKKRREQGFPHLCGRVGDATDLSGVADEGYDVVLCLGPMYHLPVKERELVFRECHRVTAKGGVTAFAYINALGAYAWACSVDKWRGVYPSANGNEYILRRHVDDVHPELFFYSSPEEMEERSAANGFQVIKNCGLDFAVLSSAIDTMTEEQFQCYLELADQMVDSRFCTGLANHALLVCRKQG